MDYKINIRIWLQNITDYLKYLPRIRINKIKAFAQKRWRASLKLFPLSVHFLQNIFSFQDFLWLLAQDTSNKTSRSSIIPLAFQDHLWKAFPYSLTHSGSKIRKQRWVKIHFFWVFTVWRRNKGLCKRGRIKSHFKFF